MATGALQCKGWVVPKAVKQWSIEACTLTDVLIPAPSPTQVRVKVMAAGANPVDWKRVSFSKDGDGIAGAGPQATKDMAHPPPTYPFPYTVGVDGAGEVESVGEAVKSVAVGDRVVFHGDLTQAYNGSFCQYALVESDVVVRLPNEGKAKQFITYEEAAAIPCATWTAYVALFDKLRVEPGRSIFIDGASGGVGSSAVQMAHHFGLFVFASCSPAHSEYVKQLGADVVLDYHDGQAMVDAILEKTGSGVDYVFEVTKGDDMEPVAEALRFGGAICLASGVLRPTTDVLFRRQLSVHYVFLNGLHGSPATRPQLRFIGEQVMQMYADGAFFIKVEVLPFEKGGEALDRLAKKSGVCGKLVLNVP